MSLATLQAIHSFVSGRAERTAMVRHRALKVDPLMVCAFQLGGEPFSVAAIAWGRSADEMHLQVAGDPRNRDLLFAALRPFARDFCAYFEAPWADAEEEVGPRGGGRQMLAPISPQVVVPNGQTVMLLGRLGRRLRFLPTDGPQPADPIIVRLGAHLAFLREHGPVPGQQLIVDLDGVLDEHWGMALNASERANLAALDAFIDPPHGMHGHLAAAQAELDPLGPRPDAAQDARVEPLITDFQRQRKGRTSSRVVKPLLRAIREHYQELLERTWQTSWRCLERERDWPQARCVPLRMEIDRREYSFHMEGVEAEIRRRSRRTMPQAIAHIRRLSDSQSVVATQRAADDPLKMVDMIASGQAIIGIVDRLDLDHTIPGSRNNSLRRPLVYLQLDHECYLDVGEIVHWDQQPEKTYQIRSIAAAATGEEVCLMLENPNASLPGQGERACFLIGDVQTRFSRPPAREIPWSHQPRETQPEPGTLEDDQEQAA
jgi:hypothetical protein